jgi:hypothetical protein
VNTVGWYFFFFGLGWFIGVPIGLWAGQREMQRKLRGE